MMDGIDVEQLGEPQDQQFRFVQLTLLAEIAASTDQIAYSYNQMLKIQQAKTQQPRPAQTAPPVRKGAGR